MVSKLTACEYLGWICWVFLLAVFSCGRGAPVLEGDDVVLSISADPTKVRNRGAISSIRLRAFRENGETVPNGTPVFLTSTGGFIPAQVSLWNGEAFLYFHSGIDTGMFTVTAQSGSITTSLSLEVVESLIQVGNVRLLLNPTNLLEVGGVVAVTVIVTDTEGRPIAHKPVVISSDFGQFESNGQWLLTDQNGIVADTLRVIGGALPPDQVAITAQVENQVVEGVVTLTANQNPVPVMLVSPSPVAIHEPVFFDATSSNDPDGHIKNFHWSFGNGHTSSAAATTHVYTIPGTYQVVLGVVDDLGASQTVTMPVVIDDQPANIAPVPSFTFSPAAPRANEVVSFDAIGSSDSDGQIVQFLWDFGEPSSLGDGPRVSHRYPGAGTYTVTLTVVDNRGAARSLSQAVVILGNQAPVAALTINPTTAKPGEDFSFDASATTDADGEIVRYLFDFGDGFLLESESPQVRHAYSESGTYSVFLTVVDNEGSSASTSQSLTVTDATPPTAMFTFAPAAPQVGELVRFDGSMSTSAESRIVRYAWAFGDGAIGIGREVTHAFSLQEQYSVRLTVTDELGIPDETVQIITVGGNNPPQACLVVTQTEDFVLNLDASCTTDQEDPIEDLLLQFEVVAPTGIQVVISGEGPTRTASVNAEGSGAGSAFTLVFILTVIDRDNNEVQVPATFLFVVPVQTQP